MGDADHEVITGFIEHGVIDISRHTTPFNYRKRRRGRDVGPGKTGKLNHHAGSRRIEARTGEEGGRGLKGGEHDGTCFSLVWDISDRRERRATKIPATCGARANPSDAAPQELSAKNEHATREAVEGTRISGGWRIKPGENTSVPPGL